MGSRRAFIKQGALLGGGLILAPGLFAKGRAKKTRITILHTNDFHSHIDPFPDNHPRYPGQGGASRIKTLVDDIRKNSEHVILLDSGDIFQGTPYFNLFGGVAELSWMNMAGYQATTLGNHEFDNGVEKLAEVLKHARFPVVNCNYDVSGTPLRGIIKPYAVLEVGGKRIGLTGLGIQLEGLVSSNLCQGIVYNDPLKSVQNSADMLRKNEKCDMVIVLSHLGYEYGSGKIDDKKLAAKTHGIDLILGGHTHTFLDAPVALKNAKGFPVMVNQAGWAGLRLGKVVFDL